MTEGKQAQGPDSARPLRPFVFAGVVTLLTVIAISVLPWDVTSLTSSGELEKALTRVGSFFRSFGAPDLSSDMLGEAFDLALQTLGIALLGVAVAAMLAWPLAVLASRCVIQDVDAADDGAAPFRQRGLIAVREAARLLLDALRGVPDFAWALLVGTFTGNGPLTGILAIAISVTGILGKIYSELWDSIDPREYAALRSSGASRLAVLFYGIQPLAGRGMLSFTLMRTECAVRNASVIGIVGGGGLGVSLFQELGFGAYDRVVTLLIFTLALTASADLVANWLRRQFRIDPNHPRASTDTSVRSGLVRRGAGIAAMLTVLVFSLIYLREGLARGIDELHRIEWRFIRDEFGKVLQPSGDAEIWFRAARESIVPLSLGWLATIVSTVIAATIAFPASVAFQAEPDRFTGEATTRWRRARRTALLVVARAIALVMRAVPEVAWVLIFATFFRLGLVAGLCGMILHSTGVLARVFTETVDNVPYRRYEQAFFGSRPQTFLWAAVPQSLPDWKTYAVFQLEVNVRLGVVMGIVGIGGLGDVFDTSIKFWQLHAAAVYLIAMVILTVLLDRTSRALNAHQVGCRV